MGFNEGGIILDREDETYYTGQTVRGRLEFELSKIKNFRGIYVDFKGFCKVYWESSHSRQVNDRTEHYTVAHESYEEYVNATTYLAGSRSGEHQLLPGRHSFPFEFQLPDHCPSSFEAGDGHVRYELKATVDRPFKIDQHKSAKLTVISPLDLNKNPYAKEPIVFELDQTYCCWCMNSGSSQVVVKVPRGGWCPRQLVPVEVACSNTSTVEIDSITFKIKKDTIFRAERELDTRGSHESLLEVKKGPVPPRTERNWVVEMEIPDIAVPNLTACRFIDIDYKFKVEISVSGCHEDAEETRPFLLGTIPLTIYQTDPLAPTVYNPSAQGIGSYPPITNQPTVGHPPYPMGPTGPAIGIVPPSDTPYPNSPYPGANPPYNGPNSPYNGPNPPYPGANPPYPGANPPYPNASPYGSNTNLPYTSTNAPYPANVGTNMPSPNVSPYPPNTGGSPYPPNTSPYPPNTSPYPPNTSPYPPNASPYPPSGPHDSKPVASTTLLKTGNYGFMAQGAKDGASMPLLPPAAAVPYPTSPYATASAPEPSTPDDEGKKLTNEETNNLPYNPEYKDTADQK